MPKSIVVYPRGFTSVGDGDGLVTLSKGDLAVELLYGMMNDRAHKHGFWGFQSQVIDAAIRLFGDFDAWVKAQREDPQLAGHAVQFIDDTLAYLETGERQMRHESWIGLISDTNQTARAASAASSAFNGPSTAPSTDRVLQRWCSHPNGVDDLLATLNLLFGRARVTLAD